MTIFRTEYLFEFSMPFEIHDDIEVLKRMGLAYGLEKGNCSPEVGDFCYPRGIKTEKSDNCEKLN
jgi:hypothetical protein